MMRRTLVLTGLVLTLAGCAARPAVDGPVTWEPEPAYSASGSPALGAALVRTHCAGCHAIERNDDSPLKIAPPLRELGSAYPVEDLQEAFAEGIVTGHPGMPQFQFTPQQIADLTAYLNTISRAPSSLPSP